MNKFDDLVCPLDRHVLSLREKSFVCDNKHTYDIAKEGYVNLLPVQLKKSQAPGDNKEMVVARHRFLQTNIYDFLLEALEKIISAHYPDKTLLKIVDAGCGEGYYTQGLRERLLKKYETQILGFDISKEAVKMAAKQVPHIQWAVATNNNIPVQTQSMDVLLSLFGFPVISEFYRVLKEKGICIVAVAGKEHLLEIRNCVYDKVILKEALLLPVNESFILQEEQSLHCKKSISKEDIDALLKMTPHFYRMKKEKYDAFLQHPPREITIDFKIGVFQKKGV